MKITIECTPLQLESISKALHLFDYSMYINKDIPKEGYALASICQDYIELTKRRKDYK